MENKRTNAPRYSVLDILRGISIISMVLYHTMWDICNIFNKNLIWFKGNLGYAWQQSICITFIFLAGFCFSLSKHKFKRGAFVFLCGGIITAVTLIFMPENQVIFGVLTFIGSAMLLLALTEPILKRINSVVGLSLSLLLFIAFKNVMYGDMIFFVELPSALYKNLFTAFLGFPPRSFWSADYFGLLPWFFLFVAGYFAFKLMREKNLLRFLCKIKCPPIEFIGRHSIIIYMVHQPVIYGILTLFSWIFRAI